MSLISVPPGSHRLSSSPNELKFGIKALYSLGNRNVVEPVVKYIVDGTWMIYLAEIYIRFCSMAQSLSWLSISF